MCPTNVNASNYLDVYLHTEGPATVEAVQTACLVNSEQFTL